MLNRRSFCLIAAFLAVNAPIARAAENSTEKSLPTIVLVGDSIRMGYGPFVAKLLEGKAKVVASEENNHESTQVLKRLDEWVIVHHPDVVHFNAGLHDLKTRKSNGQANVSIENYEQNLRQIVDRLQKETKARLVFATTTPIRDELHAKRKQEFDRREADVKRYNDVALKVMKEKGVEIDDLHAVVEAAGVDKLQKSDGTHYTPAGSKKLAEAVVKSVTKPASDKQ